MTVDWQVAADPTAVAERAVELIQATAEAAIAARGRFTLALAGGSTPEVAYRTLATRTTLDWSRWWFALGDERLVPVDDPRSNLGMARRAWLDHVPVPPGNILGVATDLPGEEAATRYAADLARLFVPETLPRFDLILLGLGDDGHTASLFPGRPAVQEQHLWVRATPPGVLPPPVDRVTLTFPVLNSARKVLFLVTGAKKRNVLARIRSGQATIADTPAIGVQAESVTWLIDAAASPG